VQLATVFARNPLWPPAPGQAPAAAVPSDTNDVGQHVNGQRSHGTTNEVHAGCSLLLAGDGQAGCPVVCRMLKRSAVPLC